MANLLTDVIGVVKQCDDLNTVTGRQSNREIKKRDLHIVDQGQVVIRLTLWGNDVSCIKLIKFGLEIHDMVL